jgi:hypothetical protein
MSVEKPRPGLKSRAKLVISGCIAALAAALFTVIFFDILTPPDPAALLNPPPPSRPTAVRPTTPTIPAVPPLFLDDNFSTRKNWPVSAGNAPFEYVQNGYLLAPSPNTEFTRVLLQKFQDNSYHDFSVEVEANALPDSSAVEYGVFFWHSQDKAGHERFIYFGLNTDGMYALRAAVPVSSTTAEPSAHRWVDLVPRTSSSLIRKNGEPNRLRVDAHPQRILAFINGELVLDRNNPDVDAFRDREDFDGGVGLIALSYGKSNDQVHFTFFKMYVDLKGQ